MKILQRGKQRTIIEVYGQLFIVDNDIKYPLLRAYIIREGNK